MIRKVMLRLVSLTAIASSTLLGFGLTSVANAASSTNSATQTTGTGTVSINMQQLDERVASLPALASLKNGAQITISDDGSVTGSIWQGTYVFHPAGSVVTPSPMYARWKDGLVALTDTPPAIPGQPWPGTLDANWVAQNKDVNGNVISNYQTVHTLIPDSSDPSVLRIPDNAWLFRVNSNGQYTALVDVFVFVSGSQPLWTTHEPAGTTQEVAVGSEPVPVASGYWQQ